MAWFQQFTGYYFFLLLVILLQAGNVCRAAEDPFYNFSQVENRLGRMIFDTYQDKQGYIWVSSANGVARYNGVRFDYYSREDGLTDLNVFSLFEDSHQRIWAVTFNGKPCYWDKGIWYNAANSPWLKPIEGNGPIQNITELDGDIIISCAKKVFVVNGNSITQEISVAQLHPRASKIAASTRFKGQLYIITDIGFFQFNKRYFIPLQPDIRLLNQNTKFAVWGSHLCITHDRNVYIFDSAFNLVKQLHAPSRELILRLYHNNDGHPLEEGSLIICTERGVYSLPKITEKTLSPLFTAIPWVSSFAWDRAGNIWLTSLSSGLFLAGKTVLRKESFTGGESSAIFSRLQVIDKRLWLGTEEGHVYVKGWDRNRSDQNSGTQYQFVYKATYSESFKRVRQFLPYQNLVYACLDGGLMVIDPRSLAAGMVAGVAKSVVSTNDDSLLIVRSAELVKIKAPVVASNTSISFNYPVRSLLTKRLLCIAAAGADSLWLGSWDGLMLMVDEKLAPVPEVLRQIRVPVACIEPLPNGGLLIGTREAGLYLYLNDQLTQFYDSASIGRTIYQLQQSSTDINSWWVASSKGVSQLVLSPANVASLESWEYRLPIDGPVWSIAEFEGSLWFATESGLFSYDLSQGLKRPPSTIIEMVRLSDTTFSAGQEAVRLKLHFHQNSLLLQFTSFYFSEKYNPVYRYRMDVDDGAWQYTKSPELRLQQLAPGKYDIEIQARDPDSDFGPSSFFYLEILPPWYATLWFKFTIGVALLGIILIFFRYRVKKLRTRNLNERKRIVQEKERIQLQHQLLLWRQEAEKAQLTPHFIFNAIYALQGYYGAGRIEEGKQFAVQFSNLVRQQLRLSGKETAGIDEELALLKNFCEWRNMKKAHQVELRVEYILHNISAAQLPTMLLQPIIENCFDHAFELDLPGQIIYLRLSEDRANSILHVCIQDNGAFIKNSKITVPAIAPSRGENSNQKGLALIKRRLELLADLQPDPKLYDPVFVAGPYFELGEEKGWRVDLKIPCSFDAYETF